DFSAARNFTLGCISGDWVLWLDASEQLDSNSALAIRQQIDQEPSRRCAYLLLIQLPLAPGQTDGEQIGRIRLWPTAAGLKFAGRLREQIVPSLETLGLEQQMTQWGSDGPQSILIRKLRPVRRDAISNWPSAKLLKENLEPSF